MSNEGFLSRWSRRKTEMRQPDVAPTPVEVIEEPTVPNEIESVETQTEENLQQQKEQEELIASLPDVEELTADSDFTGFLKKGVPEDLQKLALRKLWRSNPVFANLDGLNDYDEDFSIIKPLAEGVAEELMKLMKENSQVPNDVEEDETDELENLESDEKSQETLENQQVENTSTEDLDQDSQDDDEVGDGEDDF